MWDGGRAVTGLWADFDSICTRFGNCANFDNADNWDSKMFLTIIEINRMTISYITQETFIGKGDLQLHLSTNKNRKHIEVW